MRAEQTGRGVTLSDGGAFVTEYYTGTDIAKPYLGPLRERYGADVTRLDFEIKEHPHHRALWVSHGDVNGVDTWNEPAGTHGFIRNNRISGVYCGDALAAFTAENTWTNHEGGKLLDETTEYKLYATGAACTVVDVCITLAAAYGEVTLGPTKEAGPLAVRMAESIKVKNTGTMKNGVGGVNEDEIWMKRARGSTITASPTAASAASPSSTIRKTTSIPPTGTRAITASWPSTTSSSAARKKSPPVKR